MGNKIELFFKTKQEMDIVKRKQQALWKKMDEMAKEIKPDMLLPLGYEKAKKIYDILRFHDVDEKEFEAVLRTLELEEHPESKEALYYPQINAVEELNSSEKYKLDCALNQYRVGEFIDLGCAMMSRLKIPKEKLKSTLEFLVKEGVLEKYYKLTCQNCGDSGLFDMEKIQNILDEETNCGCFNCEEEFFPDKEMLKKDLSNGPVTIYKLLKAPEKIAWRD